MRWNMDIDICSMMVLLVVMLLHFSKRYIVIRRSRVFVLLLGMEMLAIFCDALTKYLLLYVGVERGLWTVLMVDLYYALQYLVPILFMDYMVVWSGGNLRDDMVSKLLFALPIVVYAATVIMNLFTQNLYVWDRFQGYEKTSAVTVLIVVTLYCLLYGVIYAFVHVRRLHFVKLSVITFAASVIGLLLVLRYYYSNITHVDFVVAIGVLVLYLVAQN